MMSAIQVKYITTPPPVLVLAPPPAATTPKVVHTSQIKPSAPNDLNGDRVQGHMFLMSCKLCILLTG
jgi:hypothetical protein